MMSGCWKTPRKAGHTFPLELKSNPGVEPPRDFGPITKLVTAKEQAHEHENFPK